MEKTPTEKAQGGVGSNRRHAQVRRVKSRSGARGRRESLVQMFLEHRKARQRLKQKARQRLQAGGRRRLQGAAAGAPQIAI